MARVTFNNQNRYFFQFINSRVENYFIEQNLKKTGNIQLYVKTVILISTAVSLYLLLLFGGLNPVAGIACCFLMGIIQAGIGFNVMHDANHGSFSERKWLNNLMGLTANMMGVNAWIWKQKHNIAHHTYTNIDGVDDDIAKSPFLRMCHSQKWFKLHKFQHIYCVPLYAFSSLLMFSTDFTKYFKKRVLVTQFRKMESSQHFIFWASKLLYLFFYIGLPAYVLGIGPAILGFFCMHAALGVMLALVFQLAHIVEDMHFISKQHVDLTIANEWAVHQVQTTADFATHNQLISWYTGGLNFQVEHHLFPKISHVHYPAIHVFVKEACEKFSIRFNSFPTVNDALRSHFRFLKQLGVTSTQ